MGGPVKLLSLVEADLKAERFLRIENFTGKIQFEAFRLQGLSLKPGF
ncbi:MAG: hypothetical protein ACXQTV_04370 [Candidatus Hecatellaceae archaeon]